MVFPSRLLNALVHLCIANDRFEMIEQKKKRNYRLWLERVEKSYNPINEPNLNHIIYYWFKPKFPDDFPKSLSGFSRMRNGNTANYQKLAQKIEDAGYTIPKSLDEVAEWEEREN